MEENIEPIKKPNPESISNEKDGLDSQSLGKIEINKVSDETVSDETKGDSKNIMDAKNIEKESKPLNISDPKQKKEIPIEKKPFEEFINTHLIPALVDEFMIRGYEIEDIKLSNTFRPIAGDKCWVIYCQIKNICKFWLSFEKDDITSTKSISLSKSDQNPSIIESFLIDEKRITLNLIISRILQRLNGQKLIGAN